MQPKKKTEKAQQEQQINSLTNNLAAERDAQNKYKNALLALMRDIDSTTENIKKQEEEIANLQRQKDSASNELEDLFDELDELSKK
jgi:uncharacterized coiled-coil DUF342 family protein